MKVNKVYQLHEAVHPCPAPSVYKIPDKDWAGPDMAWQPPVLHELTNKSMITYLLSASWLALG